jgi:hypothetical protein
MRLVEVAFRAHILLEGLGQPGGVFATRSVLGLAAGSRGTTFQLTERLDRLEDIAQLRRTRGKPSTTVHGAHG